MCDEELDLRKLREEVDHEDSAEVTAVYGNPEVVGKEAVGSAIVKRKDSGKEERGYFKGVCKIREETDRDCAAKEPAAEKKI